MKKAINRLILFILILSQLTCAVFAFGTGRNTAQKMIYGFSGTERELEAYRIGEGRNVLMIIFAAHGYEDNFARDGEALIETAQSLIDALEHSWKSVAMHDWSVYVLPCLNPDGFSDGYTNNGPGRCTTTYLSENGELIKDKGVDLNRCFPIGWKKLSGGRNFNGDAPLAALEAKYLAEFSENVMGEGMNVCIDVHGWEQSIITYNSKKEQLAEIFKKSFPQNINKICINGNGYFASYADSLGYDACLFEFPADIKSMEDFRLSGYKESFIYAVMEIIKTAPDICEENGHSYAETRIEPTCTTSGEIRWECRFCGNLQTKLIAQYGHKIIETQITSACSAAGEIRRICIRCGEVSIKHIRPKAHTLVATDLKPTRAARMHGARFDMRCSICGSTVSKRVQSSITSPLVINTAQ